MQKDLNSGEAVGRSGALMKYGPALLSTSKQFTAFFSTLCRLQAQAPLKPVRGCYLIVLT